MRRLALTTCSILGATLALGASAGPALAINDTPGVHGTSATTLDACGYFVGTETTNKSGVSGTLFIEKGTWTGVSNNFDNGPVGSLGTVTGSYTASYTYDGADVTDGTEIFRSSAGKITQTFERVGGTWSVSVTATGSLSFLTSDTDGQCYTGEFPRP